MTLVVGTEGWVDVVAVGHLVAERGAAVLVDGHQVAVFALSDGSVHAIDNRDPVSGANVLSRGIVGDRAGRVVVASPVYKQCFDLLTGRCLDDDAVAVAVHDARIAGERVEVRVRPLHDPT